VAGFGCQLIQGRHTGPWSLVQDPKKGWVLECSGSRGIFEKKRGPECSAPSRVFGIWKSTMALQTPSLIDPGSGCAF